VAASPVKQAFWMVVGYFILIPPCLSRAWEPCQSTINPFGRAPRPISRWINPWLNTIYGNREDGVSGAEALVWFTPPGGQPVRVPYRPNTWAPLRAWLWSAWRNSTNESSR
jgi:hypothetical protein